MKKFTIAADLSKFISASAPLTNLQHGFFCIFNGTYSGQCSTEIPRKINNAPVGCKLSPFTQRQKPCCTLNKIFWISLEERCDTWQEPIVLSFFSISTSLKIGNQQTIASVSCICNFFLYQPTETPKIYLLFQFRYIHIEELFILNDENYIVLRQWFCSFRSNYRRIFVKSILLVFTYCNSLRTASRNGTYLPSISSTLSMTSILKFTLLINLPPLYVAYDSNSVEVCSSIDILRSLFEIRVVGRFFPIWPMRVFSFGTGCWRRPRRPLFPKFFPLTISTPPQI